jgi:hypothetical protein
MTMSRYLNAGVLLLSCVSGATPTFAQNIGLLEPTLQTQVSVCENGQSGCSINKTDFWANRSGSRAEQESSIILAARSSKRIAPGCFDNRGKPRVGAKCGSPALGKTCNKDGDCVRQ